MSGKRVSEMSDDEIRALAASHERRAAAQLPVPRLVIAVDDSGGRVAIGPVITDRSVEELRRQVDDYGWAVAEVLPHWSRAQFIAARAKAEGMVQP